MVALDLTPREVALMRSLARVAERDCNRGALRAQAGWERDLYWRQARLHGALADRLEAAVPPEKLAYPYDLDDADDGWNGLD